MEFRKGELDNPQIIAMVKCHFDMNHHVTPPGSAHVFDLEKLKSNDISFWSIWQGESPAGIGALRRMDNQVGELKSMFVDPLLRRHGLGTRIVTHLIAVARELDLKKIYLETGSFDYFAPARALYARCGFSECEPFGDYKADCNSAFMLMELN